MAKHSKHHNLGAVASAIIGGVITLAQGAISLFGQKQQAEAQAALIQQQQEAELSIIQAQASSQRALMQEQAAYEALQLGKTTLFNFVKVYEAFPVAFMQYYKQLNDTAQLNFDSITKRLGITPDVSAIKGIVDRYINQWQQVEVLSPSQLNTEITRLGLKNHSSLSIDDDKLKEALAGLMYGYYQFGQMIAEAEAKNGKGTDGFYTFFYLLSIYNGFSLIPKGETIDTSTQKREKINQFVSLYNNYINKYGNGQKLEKYGFKINFTYVVEGSGTSNDSKGKEEHYMNHLPTFTGIYDGGANQLGTGTINAGKVETLNFSYIRDKLEPLAGFNTNNIVSDCNHAMSRLKSDVKNQQVDNKDGFWAKKRMVWKYGDLKMYYKKNSSSYTHYSSSRGQIDSFANDIIRCKDFATDVKSKATELLLALNEIEAVMDDPTSNIYIELLEELSSATNQVKNQMVQGLSQYYDFQKGIPFISEGTAESFIKKSLLSDTTIVSELYDSLEEAQRQSIQLKSFEQLLLFFEKSVDKNLPHLGVLSCKYAIQNNLYTQEAEQALSAIIRDAGEPFFAFVTEYVTSHLPEAEDNNVTFSEAFALFLEDNPIIDGNPFVIFEFENANRIIQTEKDVVAEHLQYLGNAFVSDYISDISATANTLLDNGELTVSISIDDMDICIQSLKILGQPYRTTLSGYTQLQHEIQELYKQRETETFQSWLTAIVEGEPIPPLKDEIQEANAQELYNRWQQSAYDPNQEIEIIFTEGLQPLVKFYTGLQIQQETSLTPNEYLRAYYLIISYGMSSHKEAQTQQAKQSVVEKKKEAVLNGEPVPELSDKNEESIAYELFVAWTEGLFDPTQIPQYIETEGVQMVQVMVQKYSTGVLEDTTQMLQTDTYLRALYLMVTSANNPMYYDVQGNLLPVTFDSNNNPIFEKGVDYYNEKGELITQTDNSVSLEEAPNNSGITKTLLIGTAGVLGLRYLLKSKKK